MISIEIEIEVAAFGNFNGILQSLRHVGEKLGHLFRRLDIELVVVETHALMVVHRLAGLDTQQHFVGVGRLPGEIMAIIGRNQRQASLIGDAHQPVIGNLLFRDEVFLQLQVKTVITKNRRHLPGAVQGIVIFIGHQQRRQLAAQAGRKGDQTFIVLLQLVPVDARPVIKPLAIGAGDQVAEVAVTGLVHAEEEQVMRSLARSAHAGLVEA